MSANPVFPIGTPEAVADLAVSSVAPARGLGAAAVDRDLSWLEFNRRVLQEALDERTPLLERVKFLAIFSSNLDEFFMKRMALIRPAPGDESHAAQEQRELLPAACASGSWRCSTQQAALLLATCCGRAWPSTACTCVGWERADARSSGPRLPRSSTARSRRC